MEKRADGSIAIPREELYALIWETPLSRLAPGLGVSDVGLGKACKRYKIPRPGRGYWARLQHGLRVKQVPLPLVEDEGLKIVVLSPGRPGERGAAKQDGSPLPQVIVPERLLDPNPLVKRTATLLAKEKGSDYGLVYGRAREGALDLQVSPSCLNRALRIADTLIKEFEKRQWSVEVKENGWPHGSLLLIERKRIPFKIREDVAQEERPPTAQEKSHAKYWPHPQPYYRNVPTGQLCLTFDLGYDAGVRKKWSDGKKQRIEDLLPKLMAALSQYAVLEEEKRRAWEEAETRRVEAERLRAVKESRIREEKQKVDRLLADVDAWHRAEQIRAFVDNTRKRIRQARGPSVAGQVEEWAKWALSHADRLDPIVEHEPTALDE